MKRLDLARSGCLLSVFLGLMVLVGCSSKTPEDVIQQTSDFLQSKKSFRVKQTMHVQVDSPEGRNEMNNVYSIQVERPNRMLLSTSGDFPSIAIASDGQHLATYWQMIEKYMVEAAPSGLDGILHSDAAREVVADQGGPFVELHFADDISKTLLEEVESSEYLGIEDLDGVSCHHCKFVHPEMDWEIWVDAGSQAIIHQVVLDLSKRLASDPKMASMRENTKIEVVITWTDWEFDVAFADADFQLNPSNDAQQVDSIIGFVQRGPPALVGRPAPAFTAPLLDGGELSLEKHQGQHIVILDFWASWCRPCREAMPLVAKICEGFQDQGVIFYSVNLGESPTTIHNFLNQVGLNIPVVLDAHDTISNRFLVDNIPQTVLVGKDGRVQAVHVGVIENFEGQLINQLESLLEGKDLTQKWSPEAPVYQ